MVLLVRATLVLLLAPKVASPRCHRSPAPLSAAGAGPGAGDADAGNFSGGSVAMDGTGLS